MGLPRGSFRPCSAQVLRPAAALALLTFFAQPRREHVRPMAQQVTWNSARAAYIPGRGRHCHAQRRRENSRQPSNVQIARRPAHHPHEFPCPCPQHIQMTSNDIAKKICSGFIVFNTKCQIFTHCRNMLSQGWPLQKTGQDEHVPNEEPAARSSDLANRNCEWNLTQQHKDMFLCTPPFLFC